MSEKKLVMIAAMSLNRVIGKDGIVPWHVKEGFEDFSLAVKEDFAYFRKITRGHAVIMGRKTWESLPEKVKPLKKRKNIILTRGDFKYDHEDVFVCHSFEEALEKAYEMDDAPVVIGGAEIYKMGMELATDIHLTTMQMNVEGDTYFPEFSGDVSYEVDPILVNDQMSIIHLMKRDDL
ncbi:MAG: dihydrofolate reductase [Bacteroidota bacterium]